MIQNRVVGFEGSLPVRHHQQSGTVTAEPRYLKVSSIFPFVRIIRRTLGVSLFQRAVIEHVIEDHRNAERSDLNGLSSLILQSETQDNFSPIQHPCASDLQRDVGGKCRSEVGGGQNILSSRQNDHRLASLGGGIVFPFTRAS